MGTALRHSLLASFLPLVLAFLTTALIAGATSHKGAAAVGPWMILAVLLQIGFFVGGSVLLFRSTASLIHGGARVGLLLAHAVVQLVLIGMIGFSTLVLFNR
ncbi:MAG: hypothetical protein U1A78_35435 [Polyangia bacterium]